MFLAIFVVFDPSFIAMVALTLPAVIFASDKPITVTSVPAGTAFPTSVGDVPTALSVLLLKVLAIIYLSLS